MALVEDENVPAGQLIQDPKPSLYEPAGQFAAHTLAPLEDDVPIEQAVQAVLPVPVENVPTGHVSQTEEPVTLVKVPAGHSEQVTTGPCGVIGLVKNDPAGHAVHVDKVGFG